MRMKSSLLAMMAMASFSQLSHTENTTPNQSVEQKRKELDKKLADAEIKNNRKKGLTRYFFGKNHLWALNEKSARKKALKNGWI